MTPAAPDGGAEVERLRVVVAALAGTAEDRATGTLACGLRDAGVEVVHAGRTTPEVLADTVVQEDADAVGLPVLDADGAPLARLAVLLEERGADDVIVLAWGAAGPQAGLHEVFPAGTPPEEIVRRLRAQVDGGAGATAGRSAL